MVLDFDTILLWIVIGLVAGFLASHLALGHGLGLVGDLIAGIVGALVGGFLRRISLEHHDRRASDSQRDADRVHRGCDRFAGPAAFPWQRPGERARQLELIGSSMYRRPDGCLVFRRLSPSERK